MVSLICANSNAKGLSVNAERGKNRCVSVFDFTLGRIVENICEKNWSAQLLVANGRQGRLHKLDLSRAPCCTTAAGILRQ